MARTKKPRNTSSVAASLMGAGLPPDASGLFGPMPRSAGDPNPPEGNDISSIESCHRLGDDAVRTHRLATLGTLAASLAHEVNNILTPVLSYAQLALASPEDAELTRKALTQAVDCTAKAAQIGSAMLGFVRVDDARPGSPACVLAEVIADAIACLGRDLARDGVTFHCRVDPRHSVAIDHVALQQVVLNLLLNAREAMRGRGGTVEIDSFDGPEQNQSPVWRSTTGSPVGLGEGMCSTGNITFRVRDTGPGIPPELVGRLFDPFVSSRSSRMTSASGFRGDDRTTGTGLGLSVCRSLIERAHGRIRVETVVDEGTMFEISLPRIVPVQLDRFSARSAA